MLQGFQKCLPLELMKEPTFLQPTEGGWWVVTKDQRGAAPLTHLLFFPCGLHPHALNTTPPLPIVLAVQPALLHLPHWTDSAAPSLPNPRAPQPFLGVLSPPGGLSELFLPKPGVCTNNSGAASSGAGARFPAPSWSNEITAFCL